jgi:hypothetical protein
MPENGKEPGFPTSFLAFGIDGAAAGTLTYLVEFLGLGKLSSLGDFSPKTPDTQPRGGKSAGESKQ